MSQIFLQNVRNAMLRWSVSEWALGRHWVLGWAAAKSAALLVTLWGRPRAQQCFQLNGHNENANTIMYLRHNLAISVWHVSKLKAAALYWPYSCGQQFCRYLPLKQRFGKLKCRCSDAYSFEPFSTEDYAANNSSLICIIWESKACFLQALNGILPQSASHGRDRLSPPPYVRFTTGMHHVGSGLQSLCVWSSIQ